MKNSNVERLTAEMSRHTVRIMSQSPHGGIVSENRRDDFLVINVNELVNGVPTGCATLVFQGDLPTTAELRDGDMVVSGRWGWRARFGSRFDVDAWAPIERHASKPVAESVAARKTRRLKVLPEAPPKATVRPAKAAKRSKGPLLCLLPRPSPRPVTGTPTTPWETASIRCNYPPEYPIKPDI